MTIRLITTDTARVTSLDDAVIYDCLLKSGILYGCEVTASDSHTLLVQSGHGIICGREFAIEQESINIQLPSTTEYARLKVRVDLSSREQPVQLLVDHSAELPPLQQDANLNRTNGIYEFQLAIFVLNLQGITSLVQTFKAGDILKSTGVDELRNEIQKKFDKIPNITASPIAPNSPKNGDIWLKPKG